MTTSQRQRSASEVNWDLLRMAADSIEAGEIGFDMTEPACDAGYGFVGDVAGHIVASVDMYAFVECIIEYESVRERAAALMNLPPEDADRFFRPREDSLDLNENRALVPQALRWMAERRTLSWSHAARYFQFRPHRCSGIQEPIGGWEWVLPREAAAGESYHADRRAGAWRQGIR
jgi:hypothetical protein